MVDEKEYLRELLTLELARKDFYEFCVYMDDTFFTPGKPHLKQIAKAFQDVAEGRLKKLAVSMPPRAGKSYITSMFCAWMLGKNPKGSIMRNSYSAKLAEKFSKDIRDGLITNPKFLKVFPDVKLSSKGTAIDGWSLEGNTQPSYFCSGVGGSITGFGCKNVAILDDPVKNIEEAMSELVIENIWNWYTSTHLSRLETGCAEIHIATRWTVRDPIGRLTDEYSEAYSPEMYVISISALDKDGKSFCEEVKTTEEYHSIRKVTDPIIWEAEFMQQPVEAKGLLYPPGELNRFKLADIEGKEPDGIVGFCDTADKGEDFTACVIGKRIGDYTYITDVVFSQDPVEITEPLVAEAIIKNNVDIMRFEANNGGHQYSRNVKRLIERKSLCNIISEPNSKNKETRIIMQSGYIKEFFYFRDDFKPGSDYDKFMRQVTGYVRMGRNKHDDGPDALTGLAEYTKFRNFTKPKKVNRDDPDYYRSYDAHVEMVRDFTGGRVDNDIFRWEF